MKKLTVQEYANLSGISPSTVWKRVRQGKVKFIKETFDNREMIMVLVEDEKDEEKLSPLREVNLIDENQERELTQFTSSELPYVDKFLDEIERMNERLDSYSKRAMEYAETAGQAKLLIDSENKTKEEYFKILQENATLKAKLDLTQEKMTELQEKLKQQDQSKLRSWWSKL